MKITKVRIGQEARDLTGKDSKGELFSLELRVRAVEMKAILSISLQCFVKHVLGHKPVYLLDEIMTDFAACNQLFQFCLPGPAKLHHAIERFRGAEIWDPQSGIRR